MLTQPPTPSLPTEPPFFDNDSELGLLPYDYSIDNAKELNNGKDSYEYATNPLVLKIEINGRQFGFCSISQIKFDQQLGFYVELFGHGNLMSEYPGEIYDETRGLLMDIESFYYNLPVDQLLNREGMISLNNRMIKVSFKVVGRLKDWTVTEQIVGEL